MKRSSIAPLLSRVTLIFLATSGIALGCAVEPVASEPAQTEDPLKTKDHSAITGAACRAHGLGENFCSRVQAEAFNVDHNEWSTLAAHAQPEAGQSPCDAAKAVQTRLRSLGGEIHTLLAAGAPDAGAVNRLAVALGRSLHTVQDNCAHNGMSNPQHAWYSTRDWCISSGEDPDSAPAALQCAKEETDIAVRAFRDALRTALIDPTALGVASSVATKNPTRANACSFLRSWNKFDGNDARWDNQVTRGVFKSALVNSLNTGRDATEVCADGASIAIRTPKAHASVSDPFCPTLSIYCVGE